MKVKEFVNGFTKATDKEKYVKKHIVRTYVNYEDKVAHAKKIVDDTLHIDGLRDGEKIFSYQTPNRYLLFIITLFRNYTDVEFEDNVLDDFNLIEENNLSAYVAKQIGDDYQRFQTVIDMVYDDMVRNERDIVAYIDRKLETFSQLIENAFETISKEGDMNGESG